MKSLWNDVEAASFSDDLALRVYTSRLLGRDPSLVLHGGGNTSVKCAVPDVFGDPQEVLFVKGSGWDLATIQPGGFAACRMPHLLRLATLTNLSDTDMARELRACMTDPAGPAPSVEAILHAVLPFKYVDHTHANALVTLTNTPGGLERVREVYGDRVVVIPYVMPGFRLARLCAELYPRHATDETIGMVLMNHGLFSFADTARQSYERMIELVSIAERYHARQGGPPTEVSPADGPRASHLEIARLRRAVSDAACSPVVLAVGDDPKSLSFARRSDLATVAGQGPATPDHVIRTKRVPLVGRDVAGYVRDYQAYFDTHAARAGGGLTMLDAAPRVIIDPAIGVCAVGRSASDAQVVADIYGHTIDIIAGATTLGGWRALPAWDIFEVEYWDLEQAKLRKAGKLPAMAGEVALVTGAASGIGRACVDALLARGAAVVGVDVNSAVNAMHQRADFLGITVDLTDAAAVEAAFDQAVRRFGGLDVLVLNAGIFPASRSIAEMDESLWRRVMSINVDANVTMMRLAHPLLSLASRGGRVVIVGSKNVPAPGPGAAAYSASKAAVNQLARVAALEWGGDGIRVNSVHPNAVFDTGLWTDDVLQKRAASYGLTVEQYKTNNVLKVEVTSHDVATLIAEMCGPAFSRTTGAQVPIDGGNDRVI